MNQIFTYSYILLVAVDCVINLEGNNEGICHWVTTRDLLEEKPCRQNHYTSTSDPNYTFHNTFSTVQHCDGEKYSFGDIIYVNPFIYNITYYLKQCLSLIHH